ncbi:MAG TPA: FGGY-family carbohydrate kinase, partial [Verrucomicrobiae bacterium]
FIRHGDWALMGTEIAEPIVNDVTRELQFSNQIGLGGSTSFHKRIMGFWILEECERYWRAQDREIDRNVLIHFAGSSKPFESLVDLTDPRFQTPGDMPLKIQEFCRETNQSIPRKPGQITRCILESLAFLHRKTLGEIEALTGRKITKVFVLDGQANSVLNHFTANALQLPVVVIPPGSGAAGNLMVQAMAQGHVTTLAEARTILSSSIKTKTIVPHTQVWDDAYARLTDLVPA